MYSVSDGIHTEIVNSCLVNMDVFKKEFGVIWTQSDLDSKVRLFLKTQVHHKEQLKIISEKLKTYEDEIQAWREIHEDLLRILNDEYDLIAKFAQDLGFQKVFIFIQYWFHIEQLYISEKTPCRVPDLYVNLYHNMAQGVVLNKITIERFKVMIPGCDLHKLLDALISGVDDWKLIMTVCREAENISFNYLVDAFRKRSGVNNAPRFVYNYIVDKLKNDSAFNIRDLLQDMMFIED